MLQHVGRVVLRDSEGDQHVFSSTPGTCLCDGQPGSHATLAIPDLDMVDTRPAVPQQEEEEEEEARPWCCPSPTRGVTTPPSPAARGHR